MAYQNDPTTQSLLGQMPIASQRGADAAARRRQQLLQTAARQTMTSGVRPSSSDISAAGASIARSGAEAAAPQVQQAQQMGSAAGQAAVQGMQRSADVAAAQRTIGLAAQQRRAEDYISRLGIDARRELLDDRMRFARDENGRLLANTKQLNDLAILKAKDQVELQRLQREMDQATKKKIQLMKIQHDKFSQALSQMTSKEIQELEQRTKVDLYQAKKELEEQIRAKEAELASRQMMGAAVGALVLGTAGFFAGGPLGAAAGAQVGANVGAAGATYAYS